MNTQQSEQNVYSQYLSSAFAENLLSSTDLGRVYERKSLPQIWKPEIKQTSRPYHRDFIDDEKELRNNKFVR
jgi:hypothetical protein